MRLHPCSELDVRLLSLRWIYWQRGSGCSWLALNGSDWLWLGSFPYLLLLISHELLFITNRSFCCLVVTKVGNYGRAWLPNLLCRLHWGLLSTLIILVIVPARVLVKLSSLLILSKSILIYRILNLWCGLLLRQNALYFKRLLRCLYWESIYSDELLVCPIDSFSNQSQIGIQTLAVTCAKTSEFKGKSS